jgi:hypothetical protein
MESGAMNSGMVKWSYCDFRQIVMLRHFMVDEAVLVVVVVFVSGRGQVRRRNDLVARMADRACSVCSS